MTNTGTTRGVRFLILALKVAMQDDGDFVNVILLYTDIFLTYTISSSAILDLRFF